MCVHCIIGEGVKVEPVTSVVLWGLVLWVECGGSGPSVSV